LGTASKRPSLTGRLTEPKILANTKRLARLVLQNEDPESVQYEDYSSGRRYVIHLSNKRRLELFVPFEVN
jgi:hypothetical protein